MEWKAVTTYVSCQCLTRAEESGGMGDLTLFSTVTAVCFLPHVHLYTEYNT